VSYDLYLHDHPDRRVADRMLCDLVCAMPAVSAEQWVAYHQLRASHQLRFSATSMMAVVEVMGRLGMTSQVPAPTLPAPQQFGADPDDEVTWDPTAGTPDVAQRRFHAASELAKRFGAEVPGIPQAKFCSNDGWWVTSIELASALRVLSGTAPDVIDGAVLTVAALRGLDRYELGQRWSQWVRFCRDGVEHGGVRVW
jgi:hypothetical protein